MPEQVLACSGDSFGVELIVKQLLEMNRYICCANQQIVIIGIYNPGKRFHAAWCDDHAIAAKWNVLETNELFFEQLCTSFQDEEPGKPLIFKEKKISDVRFYRSYVAYCLSTTKRCLERGSTTKRCLDYVNYWAIVSKCLSILLQPECRRGLQP